MTDDASVGIRTPLEHLELVKINGWITSSEKMKHGGKRLKSRQEVLVIMMDVKVLLNHICIEQRPHSIPHAFTEGIVGMGNYIMCHSLFTREHQLEPRVRNVRKSLNAPHKFSISQSNAWAKVACKWNAIP